MCQLGRCCKIGFLITLFVDYSPWHAGMAIDMLTFIGEEDSIGHDTTLKDCYKLCEAFSNAQEPIHIYTASMLHIKYDVAMSDLQNLSETQGKAALTELGQAGTMPTSQLATTLVDDEAQNDNDEEDAGDDPSGRPIKAAKTSSARKARCRSVTMLHFGFLSSTIYMQTNDTRCMCRK